jgi:hypothetical protein
MYLLASVVTQMANFTWAGPVVSLILGSSQTLTTKLKPYVIDYVSYIHNTLSGKCILVGSQHADPRHRCQNVPFPALGIPPNLKFINNTIWVVKAHTTRVRGAQCIAALCK